jgi:hypothetical protein
MQLVEIAACASARRRNPASDEAEQGDEYDQGYPIHVLHDKLPIIFFVAASKLKDAMGPGYSLVAKYTTAVNAALTNTQRSWNQ